MIVHEWQARQALGEIMGRVGGRSKLSEAALSVAAEALKLQISKRPYMRPWEPDRCPSCGYELSESLGDGYYTRPIELRRCLQCSQKLKW